MCVVRWTLCWLFLKDPPAPLPQARIPRPQTLAKGSANWCSIPNTCKKICKKVRFQKAEPLRPVRPPPQRRSQNRFGAEEVLRRVSGEGGSTVQQRFQNYYCIIAKTEYFPAGSTLTSASARATPRETSAPATKQKEARWRSRGTRDRPFSNLRLL